MNFWCLLSFRRSLDRDRDRRRDRERERERERERLDRYSGSRSMRPPSVRRPLNRRRLVFFCTTNKFIFALCAWEIVLAVPHAEVRRDIVVDHRVLKIGVAGDHWIVEDDPQRDAIGAVRPIDVGAVVRRMDEIDRAGMIDLPHATDQVDGIAPENDGIRIVDLDLRIVDRDPRIKDHRWIVREMRSGLLIVQRVPRIRQRTGKWMRKLKDRLTQDREKNCEMAGLNQVARKVARVVPLAMRTSHLGEWNFHFEHDFHGVCNRWILGRGISMFVE